MSRAPDRFDTPTQLALNMIAAVSRLRPRCVADFAVGGGALLKAAAQRWPTARIIATDLCKATVQTLRRAHPDWETGCLDFLDERMRVRRLTPVTGKVGLILLNPPFSCRGGTRSCVDVGGRAISCSLGMAFVLTALRYLAPSGQIVALLPSGTLRSEKDADAWLYLQSRFAVRLVGTNDHKTFKGCSPRTVVVHLHGENCTDRAQSLSACNVPRIKRNGVLPSIEVQRGSLQMHDLPNQRHAVQTILIHSTNLQEGAVAGKTRAVRTSRSLVSGPAVLLPRVGQPAQRKIAVLRTRTPVALSDCVMAIKCRGIRHAEQVKALLVSNWDHVAAAYDGTCAPYLTLPRLCVLLSSLGLTVPNSKDLNGQCGQIRRYRVP